MAVLLLVSLCVATAIQVTSSQSTYEHEKDNSCGRIENTINDLATAVSRLQRDVAQLKDCNQQKAVKGMPKPD